MRAAVCRAVAVSAMGLLLSPAWGEERASGLAPPVIVEADGEPIDVEVGHAAPHFADFDEDGVPDLLVGQFGEGKLRIYRNEGTAAEPVFKNFTWFKAGADLGVVPAG